MKEALVVMAKAPIAGTVKTRLIGETLSAEDANLLYIAFLGDAFALMEDVMEEREELSLVLCHTPEGEEEAFEEVEREGSMMIAQRGESLGERLRNCFADLFERGFEAVVVIGADSPTLPGELLYDAFECLEQPEDVALGPTADGGYYLIGMRGLHEALFQGIPWSTAEALPETTRRAEAAGLNLILLPEWYDVDTPDDLARLKQELAETREGARLTRRFLKQLAKRPAE